MHVHVHIRNIPWVRGVFSECKSEDHVWFEDRWMVASLCDE
jgi:hypothetical protein